MIFIAEIEENVVFALIKMLKSMELQDLVLSGKLDLFNNGAWKAYWKDCNVQTISIQDRLRTQGFIYFIKNHAKNPFTTTLILKRDLTLNDIFYLYYYLNENTTVKNFQMAFVDTGVENNSNFLIAPPIVGKKREAQIMVPADRMELTTPLFQPLSLLSNNTTIQNFTIVGYMPNEMGDFIINGLSVNVYISQLSLINYTFNSNCLKSWSLCFAVNTTISQLTSIF